jgi:hypothetical protein
VAVELTEHQITLQVAEELEVTEILTTTKLQAVEDHLKLLRYLPKETFIQLL